MKTRIFKNLQLSLLLKCILNFNILIKLWSQFNHLLLYLKKLFGVKKFEYFI